MLDTEERIDRDEGVIESGSRETESEAVSKVVASLSKLEESHMVHNKDLKAANKMLENQYITKVCNMEKKIRGIKESLGREDKEGKNLLDRPNPAGSTLLHVSSSLNDGETTRLLLEHGASPNLQDADGNSPLHIVCTQKDIQTAISILKSNGKLLDNQA